jgi:hypothetical protein
MAVASKVLESKHPMRVAAEKFDQVAPPSSVVYADDYAGMMSFYTGCRVIAADGLTNNFSYLNRIKNPRRFFREAGVDFITDSSMGMTKNIDITNKSNNTYNVKIGTYKNPTKYYAFNTNRLSLYKLFKIPEKETLEVWIRR